MADGQVTPQDHLVRMSVAIQDSHNAFMLFLGCAQLFQWQQAAVHQLEASAHLETAMDAFMSACRLQEEPGDGR